MKRTLCLIICLSMLLPIIACSEASGERDTPVTTATATDTTISNIVYEQDDLPDDLNFSGVTVTIMSQDISSDSYMKPEISVEKLSSDVINDSIYNREIFVEERLGVEIENFLSQNIRNDLEKQISAGENSNQIIAIDSVSTSRVAMYNYFIDLHSVDYIDFEKPWWSSLFNDEAEIMGELYFSTGSLALSMLRDMYIVYYNKTLAAEYANQIPELDDLYSIVESGKWTFDKWVELSENIYYDLNGNSERDDEDLYGIGYVKTTIIEAFFASFDIDVLSRTSDGWFELNVNTEKLYTSLEKIYNLLYNVNGCYAPYVDDCDLDDMEAIFASGSILFMVNLMSSVENSTLRNMQNEYGVLPFPKYDNNQSEYYTFGSNPTCFSIPTTNPEPDTAAAVLEAMASYSYRETFPAYFDIALKGKYMNDPGSRRMIDIIVNGYKLDATEIYFDTLAKEYTAMYRYMLMEGDTAFASKHASKANSVKRSLKAYKLQFEKNKEV